MTGTIYIFGEKLYKTHKKVNPFIYYSRYAEMSLNTLILKVIVPESFAVGLIITLIFGFIAPDSLNKDGYNMNNIELRWIFF